ncbi:MAG: gliding motility lipoprotein GldH [Prevotella sp.]|jgi:gliding motility-associated lipoprotein GldH
MKHWGWMILAGLTLCAACTRGRVYHHYNHTPVAGWEKVDTLSYNVPPVAKQGRYDTELGLRINSAFPFVSLTLIVEQTVYPSLRQRVDTINCKLVDGNGNFKGQGISYYQYHYPISQMQLQQRDSLHITVRHDMRREILPGISDVGIVLTRKN